MSGDDEHELARLLADPSLWLEPDASVEDGVLAAIRAERSPSSADVVPLQRRRSAWWTNVAAGVLGAAAAALIAVVVVNSSSTGDEDAGEDADEIVATVDLVGTDLAPGFSGSADVILRSSGTLIRMTMPGLPRREGDDFYEGWLKSCDGQRLVPIGTFHDMDRAAGWAGVSIDDFPLLTVTAESVAGPTDPAQGSSGEVVAAGAISPCPDT